VTSGAWGASGSGGGYGAQGGGSFCYRHPGRAAYVRCQHCGRTICPECQVPAPVGVQCVDCANAARAAQAARAGGFGSAFGAGLRGGSRPYVTFTLIGLCVLVFIAEYLIPSNNIVACSSGGTENFLEMIPVCAVSQPWRFLTSNFIHYGFLHILFNMWALWAVGVFLERALGRWRYLALYVICGIAGSALTMACADLSSSTSTAWITASGGASGAIFGLFGATVWVVKRLGQNLRGILLVVVINVVYTFVGTNIAWQAHVGGLVVGLALGAVYAFAPRSHYRAVTVAATVVAAVLIVGVSAWSIEAAPFHSIAEV
jgi:membrane associated rhomboid family serine protease